MKDKRKRRICTILYTLWVCKLGEDAWVIHSGASKHMTRKKQTLLKLEERIIPIRYHWEMTINVPSKVLVNQDTSWTLGLP